MSIIRIPATEVDPARDWHVLRPGGGRTVYRFPIHSVRHHERSGGTLIEAANTHCVAPPGETVLVDRPDMEVDLCSEPDAEPEAGLQL